MSRLPFVLLALSALAACATTGEGAGGDATSTLAGAPEGVRPVDRQARQLVAREDMLTQMAFWAGEYQTFPNDLEAAQKFSEALRKGGRTDRAAQIAGEALNRFPDDRPLLTTYGLAQIAANQPQEALRPLALVAQAEPQNWRVRSALGAALDQLGRFDEARRAYQEALAVRPDDPGVLTNLGVSHLMAGEPADAEAILRQASALPGAPPEARQNLAIAIALQGRFDEAEQLERIDLPPGVASANVAYLRSLLSDPRRWGDLGTRS
jgi:Flp pilus assembly protein TadD